MKADRYDIVLHIYNITNEEKCLHWISYRNQIYEANKKNVRPQDLLMLLCFNFIAFELSVLSLLVVYLQGLQSHFVCTT